MASDQENAAQKSNLSSYQAGDMASYFFARTVYYPTLLWNVMMEGPNRRWYDRIDSGVIVGALPFRSQTKELVERENIRGVITLNEDYETRHFTNSEEEWRDWGVQQLRLSTIDFNNAPTLENILKGIDFIRDYKSRDESVYVHCKAGRGRSVTLVACYLINELKLSPEEACSYIQERRPHIRLGSRQLQAIHDFHKHRNEPTS